MPHLTTLVLGLENSNVKNELLLGVVSKKYDFAGMKNAATVFPYNLSFAVEVTDCGSHF